MYHGDIHLKKHMCPCSRTSLAEVVSIHFEFQIKVLRKILGASPKHLRRTMKINGIEKLFPGKTWFWMVLA